MKRSSLEETVFKGLMMFSTALVVGSLVAVFASITLRGFPALSLEMITQTPKGGYYLGREGGILNAIVGSIYLATASTALSLLIGLPVALYTVEELGDTRKASYYRRVLDVLCGIPSIVYGAFVLTVMILLKARVSLLWGIVAVTLFGFPVMARAIDEVLKKVPSSLRETAYALGATRWEVASNVVTRQAAPGILSAVLLCFGRAIGDAAAVMLTAGYTDHIPVSLGDQAATLPLAVFFQLASPVPEVQQRAYASGIVLLMIVLGLSVASRWVSDRAMRYVGR